MKRLLTAGGAALLLAGCIDFDESRLEFCKSLAPLDRAKICEDGPHVIDRSPAHISTGIPLSVQPTVTFDQDVMCGNSGLRMIDYVNGRDVPGTTACSGNQATFTPVSLNSITVYEMRITQDIINLASIPAYDESSWLFTTQ